MNEWIHTYININKWKNEHKNKSRIASTSQAPNPILTVLWFSVHVTPFQRVYCCWAYIAGTKTSGKVHMHWFIWGTDYTNMLILSEGWMCWCTLSPGTLHRVHQGTDCTKDETSPETSLWGPGDRLQKEDQQTNIPLVRVHQRTGHQRQTSLPLVPLLKCQGTDNTET